MTELTAREFFEDVARAVREHRDAELVLLYGSPRTAFVRTSDVTSPVLARVESNERAREVMAATEERIGEGLRRIAELRELVWDLYTTVSWCTLDACPSENKKREYRDRMRELGIEVDE